MKGALRHPLVAGLLSAISAVCQARLGVSGLSLRATDLDVDALWTPGRSWPVGQGGNGSARVRRAAAKARNRRAHRAKAR